MGLASRPRPAADCGEYPKGKDVLHSTKFDGGQASHRFAYVLILRSLSNPEQRYIGSTSDLRSRLAKHNEGDVPHTAKFRPWKVEACFGFRNRGKSRCFLKSGSRHAFAKRHFRRCDSSLPGRIGKLEQRISNPKNVCNAVCNYSSMSAQASSASPPPLRHPKRPPLLPEERQKIRGEPLRFDGRRSVI